MEEKGHESKEWVGSLSSVPLAEVIKRIALEEQTGDLQVIFGQTTKTIYFDRGFVVFAASSLEVDRLGHRLIHSGHISRDDFVHAAELAKRDRQRLGQALVQAGVMREEDIGHQVAMQVDGIVVSLFECRTRHLQLRSESLQYPDRADSELIYSPHSTGRHPHDAQPRWHPGVSTSSRHFGSSRRAASLYLRRRTTGRDRARRATSGGRGDVSRGSPSQVPRGSRPRPACLLWSLYIGNPRVRRRRSSRVPAQGSGKRPRRFVSPSSKGAWARRRQRASNKKSARCTKAWIKPQTTNCSRSILVRPMKRSRGFTGNGAVNGRGYEASFKTSLP